MVVTKIEARNKCNRGSFIMVGKGWCHGQREPWWRELVTCCFTSKWIRELGALALDTTPETHAQWTSARPASCPRNPTISPNSATLWRTKYLNSWACWGHFTFQLGHCTFVESAVNNGPRGPLRGYAWRLTKPFHCLATR